MATRHKLTSALGHGGQDLPQPLLASLESSLGYDFSQVRIHAGDRAARLARVLNARAFTAGRDVVFGAGEYAPETAGGRRLLAHELSHVIQQSQGPTGTPAVQCDNDDDKEQGRKKPRVKGGEKTKEKPKWTRKLRSGPRLLDGRNPSYDITFDHILPTTPKGVTQVWQMVEIEKHILTGECQEETENEFRVDIVNIDSQSKIKDQWGWIRRDDPCFALELDNATIGFDDQQSGFIEQTNIPVSESDAKDLVSKMAEPKGTYSGVYSFAKSKNCPDCSKLSELRKQHKAPNGEVLEISGLGRWKS
jgi:hypothetical protein